MVGRSSGLKENMPRYLHSVAGLGPVLDSGPGGRGRGGERGGAPQWEVSITEPNKHLHSPYLVEFTNIATYHISPFVHVS